MSSKADPDQELELNRAREELARLRADNARLADLLELAQDAGRLGVWERDPKTLRGRWDERVFRFFGYAPTETPSFLEAAARIHPDDRSADEVKATLGSPGKHSRRFRVLRPDGTVGRLRSHWHVVADEQGQALRVIGVMADDTPAPEQRAQLGPSAQAEQARQAEQAQLQLALALSGIGLWRHDLKSGLLYHDERAQAMVGRNVGAGGVAVETVRGWIHADDIADVQAALERTLAGGGAPVDTQTRYHHADGSWRTVLTRRMLMRDALGQPVTILGVALDVTEQQRRTSQALQLARRLEVAAEAANVGLWSGTLDEQLPEWNPQMYTLSGRDPALGPLRIGQWLRDHVVAEDRTRVAADILAWVRGPMDRTLDLETCIEHGAGGGLRWLHVCARLESDGDGRPRAFGVMHDVTQQRQALERLREANERTSLSLSAAGMGSWSQDRSGEQVQWDEQMFRLRGLPPAEQVPDSAARFALVMAEDRDAVAQRLQQMFVTALPLDYEYRIQRAGDGAVRTLASRSIALTDEQGRVTRRIGVNWDVTDIRSVERVQRERELALRESRTKSALFARISHELRTPLNAVLGFTQLMQSEDERATPAQRQYRLGQIQTAGRSLLALVDDVLDLSEQAESLRDAVRTPMALAAALDQAVAAVSRAASARGVAFEFGDLSAVVAVDERRLQQLLLQLLGNAVKFSRPHGSVRLGSRIVGREAVLTIEDSGPGIDAERARRLFEAFESATGSDGNAAPSPGIGLAIGQALAQRMGARIELASTGPQGSLFELWLPLAETPAAPQPQPQPQQPPQQPPQPQPQPPASALAPTLLYIEDNDVNMLIVRELLAQRPRVVFLGAPDGHSGVRLARERLPSLVLIDMQLPDIDGIEVLRQLRADPRTASIPCVALSANAMREDVRSARAAGFDDYWTKPIDMPAFLRALDRLLPGAW